MDMLLDHQAIRKPFGYQLLNFKTRQLWNPVGSLTLIDLEQGYFIAKFELKDDFLHVISGGP